MEINFRPHHFLCAFCFRGRGYSPAFITNFTTIMDFLNSLEGDDANITIVNYTDSICAPCPSRHDQLCASQEKITALDHAHAQALNIQNETHLTWKQAKNRIATYINLETFNHICARCNWKELGICESVLREKRIIKS